MGEVAVPASKLDDHLRDLAADYHELVFPAAILMDETPSALEALRMISKAHPVVIKGFSPIVKGKEADWSVAQTFVSIHGDGEVTIAVTDDGLADSVRTMPDGTTTFVKPLEERMGIRTFLDRVRSSECSAAAAAVPPAPATQSTPSIRRPHGEALYLQSQDGNIYRSTQGSRGPPELAAFQSVIERDVPWMRDATGAEAEAVNLWIGTSKSTTSFHHDPYENIYHVLSGTKTFTLLSPIDGIWLDQRFHPPSTLARTPEGGLWPQPDPFPAHPVPWVEDTNIPDYSRPIMAHLEAGDTLYLPSGWWHMVEQQEGPGGLAVAVNYWYASELRAEQYALDRFVRRVARSSGRDGVLPVEGDGESNDDDSGIGASTREDPGVWDSDVDSAEEWEPSEWGR